VPTITKPTRITHTSATCIDNIYISAIHKPNIYSGILCEDISDHLPIINCVGISQSKQTRKPLIFKKRLINNDTTRNIANAIQNKDWKYLEQLDINQAYTNFTQEITSILDRLAPEKIIKIPASQVIRDPWMTKGLIKSSKTLSKLHKQKLTKANTHPNCIKYLQYRNMYNKLKRVTKQNYYDKLLLKYKHDIRKTWGVINSLIGRTNDKTTISESFKINNQNISDKSIIANEFCNFFSTIGQKYANEIPNSQFNYDYYMNNKQQASMFMSPTDPYEIVKMIDLLKRKNSSGHDKLSSSLIKDIKNEIAHPLTILFNKSFSSGSVPDLMKLAEVIPIYKSKDKELLNNYRPISLLPTFSKLIEKLVHKRLSKYLLSQSIFYPSQYGFRSESSTNHAVHEFVDHVITSN